MTVDKGCVSQLSCSLLAPTTTSSASKLVSMPAESVHSRPCTAMYLPLSEYHLIHGAQYMHQLLLD